MLSLVTQTLFIAIVVGGAFWSFKLIRHLFLKNDLDNIPGPVSSSFLAGNLSQLFDVDAWEFNKKLADEFGRVMKVHGLFGSRYLYTYDPKAIHHIFVKDQHIFEESGGFFVSNALAFGGGLLATQGEIHKKQRKMLNPVFSTVHMRNMVPMFNNVTRKLEQTLVLKVASSSVKGAAEIDILHWMSRAALEMLGQSGLGYSFDSLQEGVPQHPFCEAAKNYGPAASDIGFAFEFILPHLINIGSAKFRRWVVDHLPLQSVRRIRDIIDTMDRTTIHIFEEKKAALRKGDEALARQIGQAKDLMSILMKANIGASDEDKLSEKEVLAQMSTFAVAATDTTSNALSRTLHLLSLHPEMQDRLRDEVTQARKKYAPGDIPYDDLVALPLLDAICRETLRLHPPLTRVMRVAKQDTVLPLATPVKGVDGREMGSILVPNGTRVFVSILDTNQDPTLWGPDAGEWKPDRWLSPLPQSLLDAHIPGIYSHLMTFIGGGRACIGFKFSQLEMKVVLSTLISRFRFSLSEKEIVWRMTGITMPTVRGSSEGQLPLKMELL